MNTLIGVVVAFLSNGTMDYATLDAKDDADCKQKVAEAAHARLEQNDQEEAKILGFSFECIAFDNDFSAVSPEQPGSDMPKHIPAQNEA